MNRPLRFGVVFGLGTVLLIGVAYFITYTYLVVQALGWTQTALLRPPIVVLFFLVAGNALLRFVRARFFLRGGELAVLYAMLCVGVCAAGQSYVQMLVNQLAAPFYHASGGNGWAERLWPYLPQWLAPRDPAILNGFYRGNSSLYDVAILRGWLVPFVAWTTFCFALFFVLLCLASLFRKRWTEEERLTYPLVVLPLAMTENDGNGAIWRSRLFWLGVLVAAALQSLNYLNFLYPNVPSLPIKPVGLNQLESLFTVRPWNQIGVFRIAFYPFAIGIGYLLTLEMSFSCWACYLLAKGATAFCVAVGWSDGSVGNTPGSLARAPFLREQGAGAFIGIAAYCLWSARSTVRRAWEATIPTEADKQEMLTPRFALWGAIAGALFLCIFLVFAGLPFGVAALFVLFYLCIAVTLGRILSEAGAGWAYGPMWTPVAFTTDAFGANTLSVQTLVTLQTSLAWTGDTRDVPMGQQLHGLRVAQEEKVPLPQMRTPLLWAAFVGLVASCCPHS